MKIDIEKFNQRYFHDEGIFDEMIIIEILKYSKKLEEELEKECKCQQ